MNPIERRDEILELLFWLEGEGLESETTLERMARFLHHPEGDVETTLNSLVAHGDVTVIETPTHQYRLTDIGRGEAGRRFAEEFAPLLSQGHGECNDPDCDCHTSPDGAAACRHRAGAEGHTH